MCLAAAQSCFLYYVFVFLSVRQLQIRMVTDMIRVAKLFDILNIQLRYSHESVLLHLKFEQAEKINRILQ